ncbi:hypothetical protein [Hymenobacter sp. B81]|uniref:hypothetical protein n=1 Tax=Hymenobacter sp. B81 TaxID=3344878 RepID=UPI0037DCBDD3
MSPLFAYNLGTALLLSACAVSQRPPNTAFATGPLELSLQAQADSVYNIVWLRATFRNPGPEPAWLAHYADTIEAACTVGQVLQLAGRTPQGDLLSVCPRCRGEAALQPARIDPGQQRTMLVQVDLNRVFPSRFVQAVRSPTQPDCSTYFNRTTGRYELLLRYQPPQALGTAAVSNTVRIWRK